MQSNLQSRLASFDVMNLDIFELEARIEMDDGGSAGCKGGYDQVKGTWVECGVTAPLDPSQW